MGIIKTVTIGDEQYDVNCYCHPDGEPHRAAPRACGQCAHLADAHRAHPGVGCTVAPCLCLNTPDLV